MSARVKYFSYYLLTITIVLLLCSAGIGRAKRLYSIRQEHYVEEKVIRIFQETERILEDYYRLCEDIAADRNIKELSGERISDQEISQVQRLYEEADLQELGIRRIAIYLDKSNSIISNGSIYSDAQINTFFGQYDGKLSRSFLMDKKGAVYRNVRGEDYILITRKLYGYSDIIGSLIVEYDPGRIREIDTGELYLYIGNNKDYQYAATICSDAEYQKIVSGTNSHGAADINGEECLVSTDIYSRLNTAIRVVVPEKILQEGLYQFDILRIGVLLLCLSASIPFILYFYIHITVPTGKLAGKAGITEDKGNVEQVALKAEERMSHLERELHDQIKDNRYFLPLAMGEKLNRVLTAVGNNEHRIAGEVLEMMGLDPDNPCYIFAVHILYDEDGIFQNEEENLYEVSAYDVINNIVSEKIFVKSKGFLGIDRSYFPAVVQQEGNISQESLKKDLKDIEIFLQEFFKTEIAYTRPRLLKDAGDLKNAWQDTRNEISYLAFWKEDRKLISVNDRNAVRVPYYKTVRNLVSKLEENDYRGAWELFEQIADGYMADKREDHNWRTDRYQIYVLAGIIVTAMYEQTGKEELCSKSRDAVESLYQIDNIREFREKCASLINDFLDADERGETASGDDKVAEIRQYILDHFAENTLNVSQVANHFGKSKSYLSHLFKDTFGINISEYIQGLRVDRAKELLAVCSVKEAAERSGFWDTQALTRVMKKYEGITPGEFKRQIEKKG